MDNSVELTLGVGLGWAEEGKGGNRDNCSRIKIAMIKKFKK